MTQAHIQPYVSAAQDADTVVVPRWALEFVLYRYKHGVAYRDGATGTAEGILQNCLDTQQFDGSEEV